MNKFKTEFRYNLNNAKLGIPEEIGEQSTNRTPLEPFQNITSHILSSKTNIFFKNSSLQAIIGYTANNREEFEDHHHEEGEEDHEDGEENEGEEHEGEGPALDMKLETLSYNLQYNLAKIGAVETIIGVQGMNQTNRNFGEEILIPEEDLGLDRLVESLRRSRKSGKTSSIVIVAEGDKIGKNIFELKDYVDENMEGYDVRVSVLGHMQRGGTPSCFDRVLASRMGVKAVESLLDGKSNYMVGLQNSKMELTPLDNAIKGKTKINLELLRVSDIMST